MEDKNVLKKTYRVQALERALDILDCFSFQNREMTLSDIVRHTGLNKTTAKRLMSNLTAKGYLQHDSDSKCYKLGLRLFELGGIVYSSFSLMKIAGHHISQLRDEIGSTVLLGALLEDELVYLDKREGKGAIRITSDIGGHQPPHYGMLGMILMAFQSEDRIHKLLKGYPLRAFTPYSITDNDAFILRLEKIRSQGYVVESEEAVEAIIGIAAPIRDYSRRVVAAVGIGLAIGQARTEKDIKKVVKSVQRTADIISSDLGYPRI